MLKSGNPILDVFGLLDAALTPDQIEEVENCDVESIRKNIYDYPWTHNSARHVVMRTIHETSSPQYWDCPLREELAKHQLYHRDDMAEALSAAYYLRKRGGNPVEALEADYCLGPHGLLTWEDIDKVRDAARFDRSAAWWKFDLLYQEGDRLIHYNLPTLLGLLLVRGDRLVSEFRTVHMCISKVSLRWRADYEHFLSLGGNKGFLAGDFDWPDPNWVNPVTDEWEMSCWSTKDEEL